MSHFVRFCLALGSGGIGGVSLWRRCSTAIVRSGAAFGISHFVRFCLTFGILRLRFPFSALRFRVSHFVRVCLTFENAIGGFSFAGCAGRWGGWRCFVVWGVWGRAGLSRW